MTKPLVATSPLHRAGGPDDGPRRRDHLRLVRHRQAKKEALEKAASAWQDQRDRGLIRDIMSAEPAPGLRPVATASRRHGPARRSGPWAVLLTRPGRRACSGRPRMVASIGSCASAEATPAREPMTAVTGRAAACRAARSGSGPGSGRGPGPPGRCCHRRHRRLRGGGQRPCLLDHRSPRSAGSPPPRRHRHRPRRCRAPPPCSGWSRTMSASPSRRRADRMLPLGLRLSARCAARHGRTVGWSRRRGDTLRHAATPRSPWPCPTPCSPEPWPWRAGPRSGAVALAGGRRVLPARPVGGRSWRAARAAPSPRLGPAAGPPAAIDRAGRAGAVALLAAAGRRSPRIPRRAPDAGQAATVRWGPVRPARRCCCSRRWRTPRRGHLPSPHARSRFAVGIGTVVAPPGRARRAPRRSRCWAALPRSGTRVRPGRSLILVMAVPYPGRGSSPAFVTVRVAAHALSTEAAAAVGLRWRGGRRRAPWSAWRRPSPAARSATSRLADGRPLRMAGRPGGHAGDRRDPAALDRPRPRTRCR